MNTATNTKLQPTVLAVLIASAFATQAYAQEATSNASKEIQEVIVTAQKRPEAASKTPVSLTALSAEELEKRGVHGAEDLTNVVPNVQIGSADGGKTNIYIRGIGSNNSSEIGDPAAAFHVDGVYLARPDQARNAFLDVERVEVLRGPQGTLYGRNATAGAVNVITNKPADNFSARASLEIGDYNLRRAEAVVNMPVNATLSLRAAIVDKQEDNYIATPRAKDNKNNQSNGRIHALFKVTPETTWLLTADGSHVDGPESAGVPLPIAADKGHAGQVNDTVLRADGNAYYTGVTSEFNTSVIDGVGFTWLASKHNRRIDWSRRLITPLAPNGSENKISTASDQLSNEFRLSSTGNGPLRWVGGLYLFKESQGGDAIFSDGFLAFNQHGIDTKSRGLFGQATYSLTSSLRMTGGLRQSRDEKWCENCTQYVAGIPAVTIAGHTWSSTDWKVGFDYDLDRNTMAYIVAASGYKAGGYNIASPTVSFLHQVGAPVHFYNPERLKSVEVGIKGKMLGNRGRYTAALFNYDYKDLQVSTLIPVGGGLTTGGVDNAAKARVYGFEGDMRLRVGEDGTVNAAMGLTHAAYGTFQNCTDELTGAHLDCSGRSLRNVPKLTLTVGYEHFIAMAQGNLTARIESRFSSKYYNDDANTSAFRQDSFTRTNLSLRYDPPGERWYVSAYARNLENRNIVTSRLANTVFGAFGYTAPPRTVGLAVGANF